MSPLKNYHAERERRLPSLHFQDARENEKIDSAERDFLLAFNDFLLYIFTRHFRARLGISDIFLPVNKEDKERQLNER